MSATSPLRPTRGSGWSSAVLVALLVHSAVVLRPEAQDSVFMDGPCTQRSAGPCNRSEAHFVLGGLFPLHRSLTAGLVCRDPGAQTSFFAEALQWTEAFRRAVDLVNANCDLLPGLTLGYAMRDTCSDEREALRESLAFLGSGYCRLNGSELPIPGRTNSTVPVPFVSRVAGVVGPYTSSESIGVTDLFSLFRVPVVSYAATSPFLSDKSRFPHFFRTTPTDMFTSRALVQLAHKFNWTFVNVVHTNDNFGLAGESATTAAFSRDGDADMRTCVGTQAEGTKNDLKLQPTSQEALDVWKVLLDGTPQSRSSVAVLFAQRTSAEELFRVGMQDAGIRDKAMSRNLTFLGVGAWGDVLDAVAPGVDIAKGSLSAIAFAQPVPDFDAHFGSLHPSTTHDNPWLEEAWQAIFNCSLTDVSCLDHNLTNPRFYKQSSKVPFVYNAVFAYAQALHNIYVKDCNRSAIDCASLRNATRAIEALKEVSFVTLTGERFQFDRHHDPITAEFAVKNIVVNDTTRDVVFRNVGMFRSEAVGLNRTQCVENNNVYLNEVCFAEQLDIDLTRVVWNDGTHFVPQSTCSPTCMPGFYVSVPNRELPCCWECIQCEGHTISEKPNSLSCSMCQTFEEAVAGKTMCDHVRVDQWDSSEPFAIVIAILAVTSIVTVLACALWVTFHRQNAFFPLGIEPTWLCLLGILVVYLGLFLELGGPSAVICGMRSVFFSLGVSFAVSPLIVYAVYRYCVMASRPEAGFLFSTRRRAILSLPLVVVPVVILLLAMLVSPPKRADMVDAHVKEERSCENAIADSVLPYYADFLFLVCLVICAATLWSEHRADYVYLVDVRPRVLYFSATACIINIFISVISLVILQATKMTPTGRGNVVHILIWLNNTALLLVVFTQQLRQLGLLNTQEKRWLDELRKQVQRRAQKSEIWRTESAGASDTMRSSRAGEGPKIIVFSEEPKSGTLTGSYGSHGNRGSSLPSSSTGKKGNQLEEQSNLLPQRQSYVTLNESSPTPDSSASEANSSAYRSLHTQNTGVAEAQL